MAIAGLVGLLVAVILVGVARAPFDLVTVFVAAVVALWAIRTALFKSPTPAVLIAAYASLALAGLMLALHPTLPWSILAALVWLAGIGFVSDIGSENHGVSKPAASSAHLPTSTPATISLAPIVIAFGALAVADHHNINNFAPIIVLVLLVFTDVVASVWLTSAQGSSLRRLQAIRLPIIAIFSSAITFVLALTQEREVSLSTTAAIAGLMALMAGMVLLATGAARHFRTLRASTKN